MRQLGVVILCLAAGTGIGYWLTPTKVVEKERVITEVKRDVVTKTVTVKGKDGSNTTSVIMIDRSELTSDSSKSKTVERENKNWILTDGLKLDKLDTNNPFVFVQRRILGEIYIGAGIDREGSCEVGVSFRF